jgi:hypothetical protein
MEAFSRSCLVVYDSISLRERWSLAGASEEATESSSSSKTIRSAFPLPLDFEVEVLASGAGALDFGADVLDDEGCA